MARHFKGSGVILRLIEYMDVGTYNGWKLDVVPSAEDVRCIAAAMAVQPIVANYHGETASRWRYHDGGGEIGLISNVTGAFAATAQGRGLGGRQAIHLPVRNLRQRFARSHTRRLQ